MSHPYLMQRSSSLVKIDDMDWAFLISLSFQPFKLFSADEKSLEPVQDCTVFYNETNQLTSSIESCHLLQASKAAIGPSHRLDIFIDQNLVGNGRFPPKKLCQCILSFFLL